VSKQRVEFFKLKSANAMAEARLLYQNNFNLGAVNRLYYATFYMASALLTAKGHHFKTHKGILTGFSQQIVKPGILPSDAGRLYAALFDWRQEGDYGDFLNFENDEVAGLLSNTSQLINQMQALLSEDS
jgi:uncharacterized protein